MTLLIKNINKKSTCGFNSKLPINTVQMEWPMLMKKYAGFFFILIFQLLLVLSAIIYALGGGPLADQFAIFSYYSLAIGVLIQLILYFKEK